MLHTLGLGELISRDVLGVQLLVLAGTVILLVASVAMMILSARSAGAARRARMDAEACLRNAQDVVVEARQLSAQIDRAASKAAAAGVDAPRTVRVGARETTPEAEIDIATARLAGAVSTRNLDEARESATVPKGLLGRMRRR